MNDSVGPQAASSCRQFGAGSAVRREQELAVAAWAVPHAADRMADNRASVGACTGEREHVGARRWCSRRYARGCRRRLPSPAINLVTRAIAVGGLVRGVDTEEVGIPNRKADGRNQVN
jgi:hypothetical protein